MNYYFNFVLYAALLSVFTMSANASVVYTYTGNEFNVFIDDGAQDYSDFYNSASSLSITIELEDALATSLNYQDVNPLSYSFSDGVKILTEASGADYVSTHFRFATDSSGSITGWDVSLQWSLDFGGPSEETYSMRTHTLSSIGSEDRTTEENCIDYDPEFGCAFSYVTAYVPENQGAWSVSSVPLPAAVWLFGSGLIGLAGIARRKNIAIKH